MEYDYIKLLIIAVGTVVWWLLRDKDSKQQQEIEEIKALLKAEVAKLWEKHDEDVDRLRDLEIKMHSDHYVKGELDAKFDKLEKTFAHGFESLGRKFDDLSAALMAHMRAEESKK